MQVWTVLVACLDAEEKFKHWLFLFDSREEAEQLAVTMRDEVRPDGSIKEVLAIEVEEKLVTSLASD